MVRCREESKILYNILAKCFQEHIKNPLQPSRLHPRDAEMVQHMKICQCNPPDKQTERNKNMIISLDNEKVFVKIQHLFMIEVLQRPGIHGAT